jgi:hypothetical protein
MRRTVPDVAETTLTGEAALTTDERDDHSPARVLAECAAKDRVIGRCMDFLNPQPPGGEDAAAQFLRHLAESVLRDLAAVYADHADYRAEWKP